MRYILLKNVTVAEEIVSKHLSVTMPWEEHTL